MSNDTALLVIDVQTGMTDDLPPEAVEPFVTKLEGLISKAHAASVPVIFVQHSADDERDSLHPKHPGWAIHPTIAPKQGEPIVHKHYPDSFKETDLQEQLQSRGIKNLVICGMQTDMCVDSTTRRAASMGYDVTLVSDAHMTFDSDGLTKEQIIEQYNTTLGNGFATTKTADEITFEPEAVHA